MDPSVSIRIEMSLGVRVYRYAHGIATFPPLAFHSCFLFFYYKRRCLLIFRVLYYILYHRFIISPNRFGII